MSELTNVLLVNRAIISKNNRILVLRRSVNDSHNAGLWEFPGGKVDPGEELVNGLKREVLEETGLIIVPNMSIAHVESEIVRVGKYAGRLYVQLFYSAVTHAGQLKISGEHSAAWWDESNRVADRDLTPESRRALESFHNEKLA